MTWHRRTHLEKRTLRQEPASLVGTGGASVRRKKRRTRWRRRRTRWQRDRDSREEGRAEENCEGETSRKTRPAGGKLGCSIRQAGERPQPGGDRRGDAAGGCGRFPAKRVAGDQIAWRRTYSAMDTTWCGPCAYRHETSRLAGRRDDGAGQRSLGGEFPGGRLGFYEYTVVGEMDHFRHVALGAEEAAGCRAGTGCRLKTGALLIEATAKRAAREDARSCGHLREGARGLHGRCVRRELLAL